MESLPRLSGGRALSSDILCRNSEEPAPLQRGARMRRWLLPDASTGQGPFTPSTRGYKLSRSQKAVTSQTLTEQSERHGVQFISEPEICQGAVF
jgi:hypothetical protein